MGQNIGTCVTAVLSSIGVSRNAKKVAVVHLAFNIIGTVVCLIPFCIANYAFDFALLQENISPIMIAVVHTVFNVFTTIILLPFAKQLESFANKIIPEKQDEKEPDLVLDERLFTMPALAVKDSLDAVIDMCHLSKNAFKKASELLTSYDEEIAAEIYAVESKVDRYEDALGTYLMKLSQISLSEEDAKNVTKILHTIDDFERIGDHAVNLVEVAKELYDKKETFSKEALAEIDVLNQALFELMDITSKAYRKNDLELAASIEPLEQVIDKLIYEMKSNHIKRLKREECTIKLGFAFNDLLTSYERAADHCSNVGVAIIEASHGTYEPHEYLDSIKVWDGGEFEAQFKEYNKKYKLK